MANNVETTYRFLLGKGLSPAQAAGVIGSMQGESGKNLDPAAVNPNGGATGIAQWLGGRKTPAVLTKQLGPQLNHLWSELQGPESAALKAIKAAHTPEDAAVAWQKVFERGAPFEQKYDQRAANARSVFNALSKTVGRTPTAPGATAPAGQTTTTPGVDNSGLRAQAVQQFLGSKSADPVTFAMAIRGAQDVPGKTVAAAAAPVAGASQPAVGGGGGTAKLVSRANAIDQRRLPYQWGGGHGGKVDAYNAKPLDCSGAVSAVLGINPKVSGQFTTFGKPGDGGNRGVTIAANGHHVLMKIDGHWFGTSGSNPGGGAGWIPASQISPAYLKGFTLRHA